MLLKAVPRVVLSRGAEIKPQHSCYHTGVGVVQWVDVQCEECLQVDLTHLGIVNLHQCPPPLKKIQASFFLLTSTYVGYILSIKSWMKLVSFNTPTLFQKMLWNSVLCECFWRDISLRIQCIKPRTNPSPFRFRNLYEALIQSLSAKTTKGKWFYGKFQSGEKVSSVSVFSDSM